MKVYAHYMRTASGDSYLTILDKKYDDPIEFMKNEMSWEYEAWGDDAIDYAEFLVKEKEIIL
jgi:hypothetical protein